MADMNYKQVAAVPRFSTPLFGLSMRRLIDGACCGAIVPGATR
jgi:hypothetical protein